MNKSRTSGRLKIVIISITAAMAAYLGLSILGAAAAMNIPRLPVQGTPSDVGLSYSDVSFHSRGDNISLKGWFLPSARQSVIIIIHGGFQNRLDPLVKTIDLSKDLVNSGYNVLLFDLRGRGESGGKGYSLTAEDKDIGGAVDFLKHKGFSAENIGIIGFCSGAAGTCIYTAENNDVGAIVLDGCFTSVNDMLYSQAAKDGIPGIIVDGFFPSVKLAARIFYGFREKDPILFVGQITCPIFFIHEDHDNLISTADFRALLSAAVNSQNISWQVDDALHSLAFTTYPEEYASKISAFFDATIGTSSIFTASLQSDSAGN